MIGNDDLEEVREVGSPTPRRRLRRRRRPSTESNTAGPESESELLSVTAGESGPVSDQEGQVIDATPRRRLRRRRRPSTESNTAGPESESELLSVTAGEGGPVSDQEGQVIDATPRRRSWWRRIAAIHSTDSPPDVSSKASLNNLHEAIETLSERTDTNVVKSPRRAWWPRRSEPSDVAGLGGNRINGPSEKDVPDAPTPSEDDGASTVGRTKRIRRQRRVVAPGGVPEPLGRAERSRAPRFAHPSEAEFSHILDYYGIRWVYEPRSFPVRWEGDRILEMFTPDFYLLDFDLYVELTTLKQSLVTEKNRKLRLMREHYPNNQVKLLYKRDYQRILAKYGIGPLAEAKIRGIDQVLFTTHQIRERVAELGREISQDYAGQHLVLVGTLRGMVCFMADLMREISLSISIDFVGISSYSLDGSENADKGVRITKELDLDIAGQNVLVVEDIVDTGMTLNYILRYLESWKPANLSVCTLLDKQIRRLVTVPLAYVGFETPDEFVVGYGLDYHEYYRNLPFLGVLRPEV